MLLMHLSMAQGQAPEAPQQFANPLEQVAPAWQQAAPPDWVKPGVRLTFWAGTISIEGTRETIFIKDPRGEIYDDQGNRYRIDDERNAGGFSGRNTPRHWPPPRGISTWPRCLSPGKTLIP